MGFGSYNFMTLSVVKDLAFRTTHGYESETVVKTGFAVRTFLENYKAKYPEKVPTETKGLWPVVGPVNDFQLAQHLLTTQNRTMLNLAKSAQGLNVLMAYAAVETIGTERPDESWLDSALSYGVGALSLETDLSKAWNKNMREVIGRLAPLAKTGEKFVKGRKKDGLGPLAKAVKEFLRDCPDASAEAVWAALAKYPPKGMKFCDNRQGRYVEYDKKTHAGKLKDTGFSTFANTVSAQRKALNKAKALTV